MRLGIKSSAARSSTHKMLAIQTEDCYGAHRPGLSPQPELVKAGHLLPQMHEQGAIAFLTQQWPADVQCCRRQLR